jgi:DNA damage-binding protein 1
MNKLLRTLMFGGIDGIITIFNIMSGIEGSRLNYKYIFIIGVAVLFSDAISMGTGEYLSVKAENELKNKEKNVKAEAGSPAEQEPSPEKKGIVMFISFVLFGMIPLVLYFLMLKINFKNRYINAYVSVITALFILGVYKSKFTKEKWYKSGFNIAAYGAVAGFLAFNVSRGISNLQYLF